MTCQRERASPMASEIGRFFKVSEVRASPDVHERAFVIVMHEDSRECIAFDGKLSPGRLLTDLDRLDD
jgi:hypothetical protein